MQYPELPEGNHLDRSELYDLENDPTEVENLADEPQHTALRASLLGELRQDGRLPVFVGGTGLYFKALTGGLSDMPAIPEDIRERLRKCVKNETSALARFRPDLSYIPADDKD